MSATNHTTNYELPLFVGSDKPAWLIDWNAAMTAIDTAIHTAEGKADQAGTDIGGIESSISTINSTLTSINNAVSQLRIDTNANTGSINTITSLIGNGEPTTTDKTIIGAINEINGEVYDFDVEQKAVSISGTTKTTINTSVSNVNALINEGSTAGKIYGCIVVSYDQAITAGDTIATLTITGLSTTEAYDVNGYLVTLSGGSSPAVLAHLHFNVGNTVDIVQDSSNQGATAGWIALPPCLLFLKDLGD